MPASRSLLKEDALFIRLMTTASRAVSPMAARPVHCKALTATIQPAPQTDRQTYRQTDRQTHRQLVGWLVGWLLNVSAAYECISGTDLLRQFYDAATLR